MRFRFRPLPFLTALAVPALALLIALGVWQLDRRDWKIEQLAAWEAARDAPPIPLAEAVCGDAPATGRRVVPDLADAPLGAVRVYGRDADGAPGWRNFEARRAPTCLEASVLLTETGFEPLRGERVERDPAGYAYAPPLARGAFSADPDIESAEFYAFDRPGMAAALGVAPSQLHADGWVVQASDAPPPRLAEVPPARHLGYAVTWFGLAAALIAIYLALHLSRGRLGFTRRKE